MTVYLIHHMPGSGSEWNSVQSAELNTVCELMDGRDAYQSTAMISQEQ